MPEIDIELDEKPIETGLKASKLKRPMDREAEKIRDKSALPPSPGNEITDKEWEPWARLLTESMWNKLALYFYRLKPKIIRQQSDPTNKNYIDKLGKCIDIREYIAEMHGGGKYRVEVTEAGKAGRKVTVVNVEIPIEEVAPILNYTELDISHSDNLGYVSMLKNKGLIDDRGKPVRVDTPVVSQAITGQDMMGMFDRMLTTVSKMGAEQREELKARLQDKANSEGGIGSQIGAILLEKMKQDNPNNMLTSFAALKDLFVKQGGGVETMMPIFVSMLENQSKAADRALEAQRQHSKEMIELLKDVKGGRGGGEDALGSIDKILAVVEKVDALRGGSGGEKSAWELGLEYAKEFVPILAPLAQMVAMKWGSPGLSGTPTTGQPGKPPTPTGKQISASELAFQAAKEASREKPAVYRGEPTPPVTNIPADVAAVAPEVLNGPPQQLMQILGQTGATIVHYMNDGRNGVDLAEDIVRMYTKVAHATLASYGVDTIMQGIVSFPELWDQLKVYGEPAIRNFVDEFVNYEEYIGGDEEDEDLTATAPSNVIDVGKKGRKK